MSVWRPLKGLLPWCPKFKSNSQQIGVHEASLCVLLVLEILCSSTKLTFVLMLSAWCVFGVCFPCVWLCIIWVHIGFVCMFTLSLRCYRAQGELNMVSNQYIVNTKNPEHTLAPICWVTETHLKIWHPKTYKSGELIRYRKDASTRRFDYVIRDVYYRYPCQYLHLAWDGCTKWGMSPFAGTTILVPCHVVKTLQLIRRSGTRRFHLRVLYLQISCRNLPLR